MRKMMTMTAAAVVVVLLAAPAFAGKWTPGDNADRDGASQTQVNSQGGGSGSGGKLSKSEIKALSKAAEQAARSRVRAEGGTAAEFEYFGSVTTYNGEGRATNFNPMR